MADLKVGCAIERADWSSFDTGYAGWIYVAFCMSFPEHREREMA